MSAVTPVSGGGDEVGEVGDGMTLRGAGRVWKDPEKVATPTDRQTDRQTDRKTDTYTNNIQNFISRISICFDGSPLVVF